MSLVYCLFTAADKNTNTVCVSEDKTNSEGSVKIELSKHITISAWQHHNETRNHKK